MTAYHTEDITRDGVIYRIEHHDDPDAGAPWENDDVRGIVSEWTTRDKRPGERILCSDRNSHRYYDVQATTKKAKRDGWNAAPYDAPNPAGRAVDADFEFLRQWCSDQWHYMGVVVFPLTDDGDELRSQSQSLWGIESCSDDYVKEVQDELINELASVAA